VVEIALASASSPLDGKHIPSILNNQTSSASTAMLDRRDYSTGRARQRRRRANVNQMLVVRMADRFDAQN
jgi:predicted 2-oxoglutarate/Fe(II)-dependent dioxygenase YbiX